MIKAIVAVDEKWGIGKKNDLLFRLPQVIPQAAVYLIKEKCHYNPPGHIVRIRSDSFTHLTNASETAELSR